MDKNKYPLTYKQAERFCNDFQFLIGHRFNNEHLVSSVIEAITISPYDDLNKYMFLLEHRKCLNLEESLKKYEGRVYDVVLIGRVQSEHVQLVYKDLTAYLSENDIPFDIQKYASDRV